MPQLTKQDAYLLWSLPRGGCDQAAWLRTYEFLNRTAAPSQREFHHFVTRAGAAGILRKTFEGRYSLTPEWSSLIEVLSRQSQPPEEGMITFADWLSSQDLRGADTKRDDTYVTLDSGITTSVDEFFVGRTYGYVEGRIPQSWNDETVERAKTKHESIWGRRATHLVEPLYCLRDGYQSLPPMRFHVWLTGPTVKDPDAYCGELVVVWFGEESHLDPIAEIVHRGIRGIDWMALAEDCDL